MERSKIAKFAMARSDGAHVGADAEAARVVAAAAEAEVRVVVRRVGGEERAERGDLGPLARGLLRARQQVVRPAGLLPLR